MVRLEVIEMAEPRAEALEMLKAYAAVSDAGQNALLMMSLRRAFDMVQRYADVALLDGRFRVCADEHDGNVSVYMGGNVIKAEDADGASVPFVQKGKKVTVSTSGYVEVEFTTSVNDADYIRLIPVVMRYATAIYDGKETKELNEILKEALYA